MWSTDSFSSLFATSANHDCTSDSFENAEASLLARLASAGKVQPSMETEEADVVDSLRAREKN